MSNRNFLNILNSSAGVHSEWNRGNKAEGSFRLRPVASRSAVARVPAVELGSYILCGMSGFGFLTLSLKTATAAFRKPAQESSRHSRTRPGCQTSRRHARAPSAGRRRRLPLSRSSPQENPAGFAAPRQGTHHTIGAAHTIRSSGTVARQEQIVAARCYYCAFMAEYSIGLDLGGTNLRAAAIDRAGNILGRRSTATNPAAGRAAMLGHMVNAIAELRSACSAGELAGIGIGVPGFILLKEGVIRNSNNLVCLEGFPIRDEIEHRLQARVILENDANAAALGEKWMGAGRDVDDLVMITLGTGVGGGIISGGRVLHGYLGMAGEFGHITVVPNGNPCGCGNQGCLEKHASATAITAMAQMLHLGQNLTSRDVYDLAVGGNEKARWIFQVMGEALGIALAMLVNSFNFPLYLLSGGVLPAWEFFAPPMLEEVRRRSFAFRTSDTRIEMATLGNEAGLFGAACLPWVEAPAAKPALSE